MKLGFIGLPMSGKTTIFNALTGLDRPLTPAVPGKIDVQLAVVDVPDPRLDLLNEMFQPEKRVPAKITYADIGGLAKGISEGGLSGPFRNELSQVDGYLHVVRAFDDPNVPHPEETVDAQRDLAIIEGEFMLADLLAVEARVTKLQEEIARGKDRAINQKELEIFERLQATLEEEKALRTLEFSEHERKTLRGYGFLTMKPKLVLLNTGEGQIDPTSLVQAAEGIKVLAVQGQIEAEIAQLEPEEAEVFMEEYGLTESMRDRIIRESYDLLHAQIFYTVGEDEVRAWRCKVGANAQEAAGEIHTDLSKHFIRAEIVPVDVLLELGGISETKAAGKFRLEGKDYIMQGGDIMNVRHNA